MESKAPRVCFVCKTKTPKWEYVGSKKWCHDCLAHREMVRHEFRERDALILKRYNEGYSHAVIAKRLGVSTHVVEDALARRRAKKRRSQREAIIMCEALLD